MRILHTVESYPPSIGGMQEVVRQLSERLVGLGHSVMVATSSHPKRRDLNLKGVRIVEFQVSGNAVRGYEGPIEDYRRFLLGSDFDIITNFAAQQWATDLALPLLPQIRARKVFVPTGFSGLYSPPYRAYFEQMKTWMHHYDANVFLSDEYRDIDFARDCGIERISLIPNGADEREFLSECSLNVRGRLGIPGDHLLILHVGSHTGGKGHREAIDIFRRARLKKATLLIVGNSFGGGCTTSCHQSRRRFRRSLRQRLSSKRLIMADLTRAETVAAYQQADLFLFPSNVECSPIVLFECMASRTPFLTTDVGNAAEIIRWSGGGLLLPTEKQVDGSSLAHIDGSVQLLEQLAGDAERRVALAESGFAAWQKSFTWKKIACQYETLYQRLLTGARLPFDSAISGAAVMN